jgi:hypothetical protein
MTTMNTNSDPFMEELQEHLLLIDKLLTRHRVPIQQRPLRAAVLFLHEGVLEIEGDTKDNFAQKSWFSNLYRDVERWYVERYGSALKQRTRDTMSSVVCIYGTPFSADVPLTLIERVPKEQAAWLCYSDTVAPDEPVLSWIAHAHNLQTDPAEAAVVSDSLRETAGLLRSIHVHLITAEHPDPATSGLAQGISPHLEHGANDIVRFDNHGLSNAMWEIYFACEKAAKTLLRHHGITPPRKHDMPILHQLAVKQLGPDGLDKAVAKLPTRSAISHRYAEIPTPPLDDVLQTYQAALTIIESFSRRMRRKWRLNKARFKFRTAPWIKEPDADQNS